MRSSARLVAALAVLLGIVGLALPIASSARRGARGTRANLLVKTATATRSGSGPVVVAATVANEGSASAGATKAGVFLSKDAKPGGDVSLGGISVPTLGPHKSSSKSGSFAVPRSAAAGSYSVIVCADVGKKVAEKSEADQCRAASRKITVTAEDGGGSSGGGGGTSGGGSSGGGGSGGSGSPAPPSPPAPETVTVAATAGSGGTVAASAVSGGTCAGTSCTLTKGAGAVTFTPTPTGINTFASWSGCTDYTAGAGDSITFTNPTAGKSCTANFNERVKISWSNQFSWATVSGCGESTSTAVSGSCIVPKGSTTAISAQPATSTFHFVEFSGATCNGTETVTGFGSNTTHTMTFTNAVTDHDCGVVYSP